MVVFVAEKMNLPTFVTGIIASLAVAYFSVGLWYWAGQFQYQYKSARVWEGRKLQGSITGLFVTICILSFIYYHSLISVPWSEQQQLIERYRHVLGTSEIPNKTTLIELTNKELKSKGTQIYRKIHAMNQHYNASIRELRKKSARNELDEVKRRELEREITSKGGEEFNRELRTDATMVVRELRNRIPYASRKHIVGLPDINPADKRAGSVSRYTVMPAEFSFFWSDQLAREIEELVKLLPER